MITSANSATGFAVSNDCTALRVDNESIHGSIKDTFDYPATITQLVDPVFTPDFGIVVANSGIYKYTAGVSAGAKSYAVAIT